MCEKENSEPLATDPLTTGELPEQTDKEAQVSYRKVPVPPPPGHHIHERAKIPPVPEGEKVPDKTPSRPVKVD